MTALRICLVEAGPRGTSVLERICANAGGHTVEVRGGLAVTASGIRPGVGSVTPTPTPTPSPKQC